MGAHGVQAVVQVEGLQPVQADDPVKLRQNAVQIPGHVVSGVGDVAGIQTDPHLLRQRHPVQNLPQFLEAAAHLRSLAGHGLQQDGGVHRRGEDGVEGVCDLGDAGLQPLTGVAAGVEVIEIPRQIFHPPQVIGQRQPGELSGALILGAGVDGIGGVGQNGPQPRLRRQRQIGGYVRRVHRLGPAAPWIAGEELKGVGADGQRRPSHGGKAHRGGEMTADIAHDAYLPREIFCTEQMTAPSRMVRRPQVGRV